MDTHIDTSIDPMVEVVDALGHQLDAWKHKYAKLSKSFSSEAKIYIGRLPRKNLHDTITDENGITWVLIPITIRLNGWQTTFLMPVLPDQEDKFQQLGPGAEVELGIRDKRDR